MSSMERRPSYWTITGEGFDHSDTLTFDPDGGGEALAVFGFREEADLFICCQGASEGWRVRETTAAEIISALRGSHASVERIVVDPLPRSICDGTGIVQLLKSRAAFIRLLIETTGAAKGPLPALASLRP